MTIDYVDALANDKKKIYVSLNEIVQFTGNREGKNCSYKYNWDFRDGSSSEAQNPTHAYTHIGEYDPLFTVSCKNCPPPPKTSGVTVIIEKCDNITFKRKDINKTGEDKYGHWWVVIGGESYGWWPKYPVDLWGTVTGVEGELNGQTSFGGTSTQDPHHADNDAEEVFNPVISIPGEDDYTCAAAESCIKDFAASYSGSWSWPLGQNCHSFQESMMSTCHLEKEP